MVEPKQTRGDGALVKALHLIHAILDAPGSLPVAQLAASQGLALSSAYRQLRPFVEGGWITRSKRGHLSLGPRLLDLALSNDLNGALASIARPHLRALASALGQTVHLGILEDGMVTYLVKEAPKHNTEMLTREGMQLEAYCSGIGKVLLAHLGEDVQNSYLNEGDFIALTPHTVTDTETMKHEWSVIRTQGFALDKEEVLVGLHCLAVPVLARNGKVVAALSTSHMVQARQRSSRDQNKARSLLQACAAQLLS